MYDSGASVSGGNVGGASSAQTSLEPNPEHDGARRTILLGITAVFCGLCCIGGLNHAARAIPEKRWVDCAMGFAFVAAGLPLPGFIMWRWLRRLRGLFRVHRGRCAHCDYPYADMRGARCSECGRDPFDVLDRRHPPGAV